MNKGLTLIETLLYLALLSVLMIAGLPILADLSVWQSEKGILDKTAEDFLFLDAKLRFLAGRATEVISPRAGEYSDVFSFDTENEGVIDLKLEPENGLVLFYEDENESMPLFSAQTVVERLVFFRPEGGGFERIQFSAVLNGVDFGTTSYFHRDE